MYQWGWVHIFAYVEWEIQVSPALSLRESARIAKIAWIVWDVRQINIIYFPCKPIFKGKLYS